MSVDRRLAVVAVIVSLAAGCAGGGGAGTAANGGDRASTSTLLPTVDVPSTSPSDPAASGGGSAIVVDDSLARAAADLRDGAAGALLLSVTRRDGTTIYGSDGLAGDIPLEPGTPIRVGSVTKMFVAVRTLQLVDEGLLSLDDPVTDVVHRVDAPEGISVGQLLGQASGLPNFVDLSPDLVADITRVWTPEEILEPALAAERHFPPGDRFEYSDTNFILLGLVIEETTGTALGESIDAAIVRPLGLEHTFLGHPGDEPDVVPASEQGDNPYTAIVTAAWSTGGMVSSALDLHRFMTALFGGELISAESLEAMKTGVADGYGLGLYDMGSGRYGHGGGLPGYHVQLTYDTETGASAFLATNNGDGIDFSSMEGTLYDLARQG